MIETTYSYNTADKTSIERLVNTAGVVINHLGLAAKEAVNPHVTPDHAHMIVVRGDLSIKLNDQDAHTYGEGSIIGIPAGTLMAIANNGEEALHLFVIKTCATC